MFFHCKLQTCVNKKNCEIVFTLFIKSSVAAYAIIASLRKNPKQTQNNSGKTNCSALDLF